MYKFVHRQTFQGGSGEPGKGLRGLEIQTGLSEQVGANESKRERVVGTLAAGKDPRGEVWSWALLVLSSFSAAKLRPRTYMSFFPCHPL